MEKSFWSHMGIEPSTLLLSRAITLLVANYTELTFGFCKNYFTASLSFCLAAISCELSSLRISNATRLRVYYNVSLKYYKFTIWRIFSVASLQVAVYNITILRADEFTSVKVIKLTLLRIEKKSSKLLTKNCNLLNNIPADAFHIETHW